VGVAVPSTGRILAGVDGSPGSRRALAWAVEEAAFRGSVVEAATVWQSPYDLTRDFSFPVNENRLAEEAVERLAEAVAEASSGRPAVEIETVVLEGDPAEILCRRAAGVDLLVVGARGHGTLAGLLVGSVSSKCAHHSPRPVAVVPAPHPFERAEALGSIGRIVAGVDGSPGSVAALRWALDEAVTRGATLVAAMVWRGIEADDDMAMELATFPSVARHDRLTADSAAERLRRTVSEVIEDSNVHGTAPAGGGVVESVVLEGDPAATLCRRAAEADMLVVGSHGRGTFAGLSLGSVSVKCLHQSTRPVVIVPTGRHRHGSAPSPRA
jgi:nucleotide-binding universal stress UspA family protein